MKTIIDEVKNAFVERDEEITAIARAVLARQHVVLIGPPGIAKSALIRAICDRVTGARYFERLLRRDSTADELFGPVSLKGLENDEFRRNIADQLPEAELAFLDEIFKSNSTVLNGILNVINERQFHNDRHVVKCPLMTCVGASNELPQGEDLNALWDRFLVRLVVKDIQEDTSFHSFLEAKAGRGNKPGVNKMALADLQADQLAVSLVNTPPVVTEQLTKLRRQLINEGIRPSPRRWAACLEYLKAEAFLDSRADVAVDDIPVLEDCLWELPEQKPKIAQMLAACASPELGRIVEISDASKEAYDLIGTGSDAQAMLEANAKLRRAHAELEKIEKTASGKAKSKAKAAMEQVKNWNAELLQKIGLQTL